MFRMQPSVGFDRTCQCVRYGSIFEARLEITPRFGSLGKASLYSDCPSAIFEIALDGGVTGL